MACAAYAGLDGGASGSRVALWRPGGRVVVASLGRPLNILYVDDLDGVAGWLVRELQRLAGGGVCLYAGLAGMDAGGLSLGRARALEEALAARGVDAVVDHDLFVAWVAAWIEGGDSAVIAGSGSAFFHYDPRSGSRHIAGDHGPALGDEGSAFDAGREALARLRSALQGLRAPTCLEEGLASRLGVSSPEELAAWAYSRGLVSAPLQAARAVVELARSGCREAREHLRLAGSRLGRLVALAAGRVGARRPIAYGGLTRCKAYMEGLRGAAAEGGVEVEPGRLHPVLGALWAALEYYNEYLALSPADLLKTVDLDLLAEVG